MTLSLEVVDSVAALAAAEWDALADYDNPFTSHAFLRLLETSKSVGPRTGWLPRFLLAKDGDTLVGAAPSYLRSDSYGEYVFDWGWAQAASRAGVPYYPKITVAVPFTPATGPRLLVKAGADAMAVRRALADGLLALCAQEKASGVHLLLCRDDEAAQLAEARFIRRATHQYHFRNPGYASYDAFLDALRSSARKNLRKERLRAQTQGLTIERRRGDTLSDDDWARVNELYLHTSGRKWGRPYLTRAFFAQAKDTVGKLALVVLARRADEIVAMSLSFEKGRHLYGRYWGASEDIDCLHFELCYHQLIEHAITNGQSLVEAGAQGEHKIKRGFVPVVTHSVHYLVHPGLRAAVAHALDDERQALLAALPEMTREAPFKEGGLPDIPPVAGID